MIIALEGIDGAGKHTLVQKLIRELAAADGIDSVATMSFPRYNESLHAQLAADALHGKMGDLTESAHGMAVMFALDRYGAKEELGLWAASISDVLLLDRYVASNAAYTSARTGRIDDRAWVAELEFDRLGLPRPDLQVLVDTAPETARERAAKRESLDASRTRDRYERDTSLQDATFAAYEDMARTSWEGRWIRATEAAPIIQAVKAH
ncbi:MULTISPECIES: dTMP kinase [unclassified Corynebacterium]|uniref:dTMP kinase n=1 Tax=unclassified Corynebacterium TaxID=2624378 RepID=UPI00265090E3|nr:MULTISPECIES: dTMP kinase [unclassified Corynebacterium]MDN8595130.1 dTMP kinase [Corynebacterium sp. P4_F2]WKK56633.1 dTMP kinase [Corynebacterium sp. P4-C1]WKK64072.1 dTMP kinase [Corynebacterium sp. P8-C1]